MHVSMLMTDQNRYMIYLFIFMKFIFIHEFLWKKMKITNLYAVKLNI